MLNLVAWMLSFAVMGAIVFGNYPLLQLDSTHMPFEYGLYDALSRVGWSIALCYIIFACGHGFGGAVNTFLSHPLWKPFSRLGYSIYLVHFEVIHYFGSTLKTTPYFSLFSAFQDYLGYYVLAFFVSLIASLAFESPITIIERIIFKPEKKLEDLAENSANKTT